jgi:hypothetical protein
MLVGLATVATAELAHAQIDDRLLARADQVRGASWRVFGVDVDPTGPLAIDAVEEVRQQRPPPNYAVLATNRSDAPIEAYIVAAVVVTSDGAVKAVQQLPAIKNLRPGQARRQETPVRVAILSVTDRVAFVPFQITRGGETWKVADADLRAAIRQVAQRLPVP